MDKRIIDIIKIDPPLSDWDEEIEEIIGAYNGHYPKNRVIFTGSSSIRLWETLAQDMAPLKVLNHGFGGSRIYDSIHFSDKLVYPFLPKAVVIFSGTNDINENEDTKSAEDAFILAKQLLRGYRKNMPQVPIYYLSINRCIQRNIVGDEVTKFNNLMEGYLDDIKNMTFIRTSEAFYTQDKMPDEGYFQEDKLHLNPKGYSVWTSKIKPVLIKDLL